ncbi:MAG: hypothetical protein AAFY88_10920 [Acidobacteriota bacterium]
MKPIGVLLFVLLFTAPLSGAAVEELSVKSLAGPPAEFTTHALPKAEDLSISTNLLKVDRDLSVGESASAMTFTNFNPAPGEGFTLVQVTTNYPNFAQATFSGPNGTSYTYNGSTLRCNSGPCGSSQAEIQFEAFPHSNGGAMSISVSGGEVTGGSWQLAEQTFPGGPLPFGGDQSSAQVDSVIAFDENVVEVTIDPDPCLFPTLDGPVPLPCPFGPTFGEARPSFDLVEGASPVIGISAKRSVDNALGLASTAADLTLTSLTTTVVNAQSRRVFHTKTSSLTEVAAMPRNAAGASLMQLPSLPAGEYSIRLDIEGILEGVGTVERTGFYYLPIQAQSHRLTGSATAAAIDRNRLELRLGIEELTGFDTHLYAYAEVWSKRSAQPVAWIGGMTYPEVENDGSMTLPMVLDARWLALANQRDGAYELRNVRIQNPDTFIPLDQVEAIPFTVETLPRAAFDQVFKASMEEDASLFVGQGDRTIPVRDPEPTLPLKNNFDTGIMLVHGWCSGLAWPFGDFNNGRVGGTFVFNDTSQSRSHDNFAQRLRNEGDACFNDSFSIVAHSQGGAAAVHLRANYNSGLDASTAPRRIQSMGTPYWGSTLMDLYLGTGPLGWLLPRILGFCGPQFNLGTVGAALWQTGIPNWARDDVFYYRTRHRLPGNFWQRLQFWRWK